MEIKQYHSTKSNSIFTISTEQGRAYISVSGECCTDRKVLDQIHKVRGLDFGTVDWTARQLSNTF